MMELAFDNLGGCGCYPECYDKSFDCKECPYGCYEEPNQVDDELRVLPDEEFRPF